MPNWVFNRLTITQLNEKGLKQEKLIKKITKKNGKERIIDFNKIIPMPKSLDIESSSALDKVLLIYMFNHKNKLTNTIYNRVINTVNSNYLKTRIAEYTEAEKNTDIEHLLSYKDKKINSLRKINKMGKLIFNNIMKHGAKDWYDWCCENWGTKWNGCDTCICGNAIYFTTAWSEPMPVIKRLSEMYPNNEFYFEWAEEQMSEWGGLGHFVNGESEDYRELDRDSKELWELAFDLCGGEDMYVYDEELGTYKYREDEETGEEENE